MIDEIEQSETTDDRHDESPTALKSLVRLLACQAARDHFGETEFNPPRPANRSKASIEDTRP